MSRASTLRALVSRCGLITWRDAPAWARAAGSAPSVFDKIVNVTVIDKAGKRHALRGLMGQNLADILKEHTDELGDDVVAYSPEGSGNMESHVKVPNELFSKLPKPEGDDARWLSELATNGSIDTHSRLASRITLDADMQGLVVALGEHSPWRSL